MEALFAIFSAFGLSASAGLNAYIPLLVVGVVAHYTNLIKLAPPFDTLANPYILILLGILLIIEMLADKVPAVNHLNDLVQTFVRPVAGAIAFAAGTNVIQGINPVVALACGLFVAGRVHLAKSAVAASARYGNDRRRGKYPGEHRGRCGLGDDVRDGRAVASADRRAGRSAAAGAVVVVGPPRARYRFRLARYS